MTEAARVLTDYMLLQLKKGVMGRPGLDAARFVVEYTGIPVSPEQLMKDMEKRQEELFQKVSPMPGALKSVWGCILLHWRTSDISNLGWSRI